jgi:hypothetical protein
VKAFAVDRLREVERSYLEHILVALRVRDRAAPYRDFLDNWYAFRVREGHLTKGHRPIWFNNPCAIARGAALRRMHFISKKADAVLRSAEGAPEEYQRMREEKNRACRLMVDHAVPLGVIVALLQEQFDENLAMTADWLEERLIQLYRLGVITSEEDARLNSLGLRSAMPRGWDGADLQARYKIAGIVAGVSRL